MSIIYRSPPIEKRQTAGADPRVRPLWANPGVRPDQKTVCPLLPGLPALSGYFGSGATSGVIFGGRMAGWCLKGRYKGSPMRTCIQDTWGTVRK